MTKVCLACGAPFQVARWNASRRFCSRVCSNPYRGRPGERNANWSGGRRVRQDGYVAINIGPDTEVLEHRFLMEQHLGRRLADDEVVHHINGVKTDNRLSNLQVMSQLEHIRLHASERRGVSLLDRWHQGTCACCGRPVWRLQSETKAGRNLFCNTGCYLAHKRRGRAALVEAIARDGEGTTALSALLLAFPDITRSAILLALRELREAGRIRRVHPGCYTRVPQEQAAA